MESPASVLRRYDLHPKKSWGQCFIADSNVVDRIVSAVDPEQTDTIVEIGAGLGTLTGRLASRAGRILAIEKDRDLVAVLQTEMSSVPNVEVVDQNALVFDYSFAQEPVKVVGNLPYNISSQLLFRLLAQRHSISTATLMLQKEVVDRIVAPPGTRTYGIPSVLCQQFSTVKRCFSVSRGCFFPQPRVESAVIHMKMCPAPTVTFDEELFVDVVRAAFSSRRKTLRNALSSKYQRQQVTGALQVAGIDGTRRAETLSLGEFSRLATAFDVAFGEENHP